MNHTLDIFAFAISYLLGAALAMVFKMDDLNKMNQTLTFRLAMSEFFKYEYKSYLSSFFISIIWGMSHDYIICQMKTNKWAPDALVDTAGAAPFLASSGLGFFLHYVGYKYVLGVLEKRFGKQNADAMQSLKSENERLKQLLKQ